MSQDEDDQEENVQDLAQVLSNLNESDISGIEALFKHICTVVGDATEFSIDEA